MAMLGAVLPVLVLALAACRHAPPPPMPAVFEGVPLVRMTCAPESVLLPVEIDGTRGLFIVDSGAFVNVVYESFARRAKLVLEDNADLVGGGKGVRVLHVVPRNFAVPGLGAVATPEIKMLSAVDSPLAGSWGSRVGRDACEIAGVISPATLATADTALLVDFGAARLAKIPTAAIDEHLDRVAGARFAATTNVHEYTPGIDVRVGDQPMRMMIDTGACCTWVATVSSVGRAQLPRSVTAGKVTRLHGTTGSREVQTELTFGRVARRLPIKLLEPDVGDAVESGAIGADALRGCIVAIGRGEMRGVCRN